VGIVLGLLAAFAAVGVLLWRIQAASQAVRDVSEAAGDVHGLWRRFQWSRKAARHPLDMVTDPQEAAAAMMVALAQYDGALTEAEETGIRSEMVRVFGVNATQSEELFVRGRWATKDSTGDPAQVLKRLTPLVERHLDGAERKDLLAMLAVAAGTGNAASSVPHRALDDLTRRLLRPDG
jgi:uncharacterized tellurite resistance protein B-like protein